jgi:hypothetical protein
MGRFVNCNFKQKELQNLTLRRQKHEIFQKILGNLQVPIGKITPNAYEKAFIKAEITADFVVVFESFTNYS